MNINELKKNIEKILHGSVYVSKIDIFKEIVYIDVKDDYLYFGLDISLNGDIFLISRNVETQKIFSIIFKSILTKKKLVFSKEKNIDDLGLGSKGSDLELALGFILEKFLFNEYYINQKYIYNNYNSTEKNNNYLISSLSTKIFLDFSTNLMHKYLSIFDTLDLIEKENFSLVRFGDGEIKCMVTTKGCFFQEHNSHLMQELRDLCEKDTDGLLVCFPSLLIENEFWRNFWSNFWPLTKFYLKNNILGDAMITRPEVFLNYGEIAIKKWKKIWDNKKVCFITGENSRFNHNHMLFDNIRDYKIIHGKSINSYFQIDEILNNCLTLKDIDIFLIALGPTGTVLGARLHKQGKRALDIGHLNNSYDTVYSNAPMPEKIDFAR